VNILKRFYEIIALSAVILFTNLTAPGPALGQSGNDLSAQLRPEIKTDGAASAAAQPGIEIGTQSVTKDDGRVDTGTTKPGMTEPGTTEPGTTETGTVFTRTESVRTNDKPETDAKTDIRSVATTERILLMGHAEKPEKNNTPDLADAGFKRAESLAKYIVSQYGRPDFIFASANSKKSSRPYETALPLSKETGVPIDLSFEDKDYERLAELLRRDKRFAGKLIVVVWHHGNIPDFSEALSVRDGAYPEDWNSKVYNQFLKFEYFDKSRPLIQCLTEPF
jgi:phosphohistidine phosphatase SixA